MNVTKESILTAMVSLILGYRDKYAPASESEALNKLQSIVPEDGSLLTLELAFNRLLNLVGTSLGKLHSAKDLLDAVDRVVALTQAPPLKEEDGPEWFKKVMEEIRKNPPPTPVIPLTPQPNPYHPWINPYPNQEPWVVPTYPTYPPYPSDPRPFIICQDQITTD